MNRYFFDRTRKVLAIVQPDGKTTFHNGPGFKIGETVDRNKQDQTIGILEELGYKELLPA